MRLSVLNKHFFPDIQTKTWIFKQLKCAWKSAFMIYGESAKQLARQNQRAGEVLAIEKSIVLNNNTIVWINNNNNSMDESKSLKKPQLRKLIDVGVTIAMIRCREGF